MTRILPLVMSLLVLGCQRGGGSSAPPAKAADGNLTPAQQVARNVPVLQRTVTQNDLSNLRNYLETARAETGSYPKAVSELSGLQRDLPKLYKAIQDGEIVLAGGKGDVLAYEKAALTDRGSVLTTAGVQVMTADELKQKLGG